MTQMTDLPAELIAHIVSYLENESILTTRLTSKYIERSTLSYFGRRFFRKKGYMITTASLNVLESISKHSKLSKYVEHVWFNPDCYTYNDSLFEHLFSREVDFNNILPQDRAQYNAYEDCIDDHKRLMHDQEVLSTKLTAALSRLPNVRILGMRRSEDHRPWGWSRLKDAIGEDPRIVGPYSGDDGHHLSGPTLLFIAIINAVAATNTQLVRLYTDAIQIDNIPTALLPQATLIVACKNLLYLEVNIHNGWLNDVPGQIVSCSEEHYGSGLLRLFKASPDMRELGLQIFAVSMRMYVSAPSAEFLAGGMYALLKSYPHITLQKQVENVQLSQLRRLKLEKITTTPATLRSLLEPAQQRLTSIKLRDMRLLSREGTSRPWQQIFEFFRDCCSKLSYMLLYHLMYEHGGVSFVENPPTPVPYLDIQDPNNNPNPPYGEAADSEFFTKYDYIALEAPNRAEVKMKLDSIVDGHWYQTPMFSYAMDEGIWHTDTSDGED